jgi:hypothetical protein
MKKNFMYVICDSVNNSVFESQVITPLLKKIKNDSELSVDIISFESKYPLYFKTYERITIHCIVTPFLQLTFFWPLIKKFKAILEEYRIENYECIARGPLAGYIAQQAMSQKCTKLTIQARGLLAQETWYAQNTNVFIEAFRYLRFKQIEKAVYSQNNYILESVTPTLETYLKKEYGANPKESFIATEDIPPILSKEQYKAFRNRYRKLFKIPEQEIVYVYSGSYKPWQLPEETLKLFKKEKSGTLLIFTPDIQPFQALVNKLNIKKYILKKVDPKYLIKMLCAADYGFLFREDHIINWVARPTKALEYHAAHVKIIHNNTVKYLL